LRSALQQARSARFAIALSRRVALSDAGGISVKPATLDVINRTTVCLPLNSRREEVEKMLTKDGITLPMP